ncbi:hypothetical protein EXIGLDRAFT_608174 [Exidia glandulosa HHB12029]|uniref:Tc1-like transposase DDE domain-containing protein n=1 Tax=Exidia glandulosa HHB12029 TaxID=1314781 RepID=A0A165L610_EXIGL|nr:hypothetical protein EXIGLDRAFT_608174 [Exidia glandulosa HHB12029]
MVADFVSADYGWLQSTDGEQHTRLLLKVGKNCEGYFQNKDVLEHAAKVMDILERDYPQDDHLLIFDNAPTHTKRAPDELSAGKMPKGTPKGDKNWGVEVVVRDDQGKIVHGTDGKPKKTKARMRNATFLNGNPQLLYFPDNHMYSGKSKGMAVILKERGFKNALQLRAQCKNFKCANLLTGTGTVPACCCRRLLFNQPDFVGVRSLLETACTGRGFAILFLPKFHPELNPIEQCWGCAKLKYPLNPPSPKEALVEANVLDALSSIDLKLIRRSRFLDAYRQGLCPELVVWAAKKYHGHRVVPQNVLALFNVAHEIG